ncbi:MAG: hypothetical protein N2438_12065, partial [Limisphaera sp.]|nr:hypothetical protein [Limisphaera sp.]
DVYKRQGFAEIPHGKQSWYGPAGGLWQSVRLELRPRLQPESLRDYAGPPRPADTSLDCHKAEALLGEPMPKFREWLALQPPGSF